MSVTRWSDSSLKAPLPSLDDVEGAHLPASLPPVVDAHVHLFPDRVFDALWRWFGKNAWDVRYKLYTEQLLEFLFSRGVQKVFALHYAHKPGMARVLNAYVAALAKRDARIVGFATAFPGEDGAAEILKDAFASGLRGVKLHCHVQAFAPDDPRAEPIYRTCSDAGVPLVMHAGREPSLQDYPIDPYALCGADRVDAVLRSFPKLKLCIPHLGVNEERAYVDLLERHDNLWLDTTMAVAGYFPVDIALDAIRRRPDRVLYGTDFPNIPYAWDREVQRLTSFGLTESHLAAVLGGNALQLIEGTASGP